MKIRVGRVTWWQFTSDEVQQLHILGSGVYDEILCRLICYASVISTRLPMRNVAVERHATENLVPLCSSDYVLTTEAQQMSLHACHMTHYAM